MNFGARLALLFLLAAVVAGCLASVQAERAAGDKKTPYVTHSCGYIKIKTKNGTLDECRECCIKAGLLLAVTLDTCRCRRRYYDERYEQDGV